MDDNTYECPSCGYKIYPEMTRCPQCGQSMYPPDEESSQADAGNASGWGSVLGALLTGWLVADGIAFLINFILASLISPSILGPFGKLILFLAGPLGSLAGGYVAAGILRQHVKWLGLVLGVLTLPVLVLLATHWVEVTPGFLLSAYALLSALLTLLAGFGAGWLFDLFSHPDQLKEKWKVRGWEDLLYQDLLRKVRFSGAIADRLIEYERKQNPQASRLTLIQNAIQRWDRDNQ